MASPATPTDVLLNVGLQAINIAIFFWLFIKFLGGPLTDALVERKEKELKLADAEAHYKKLMTDAALEKDQLIQSAVQQKNTILQEAQLLAQQKETDLLEKAQRKADGLLEQAQVFLKSQQEDLENNFVLGVKRVAKLVVQKIVGSSDQIQDEYLDTVTKQFSSAK